MVKAGIITGFGINADVELAQAFEMAGASTEMLQVTSLLEDASLLNGLQILGFPGGFSFGDHLGSGRVFAQLVRKNLKEALVRFTDQGGLVIGICNGFQTLVKMGILPNLAGDWTPETTLITNDCGVFQDRWVSVRFNPKNTSPWISGMEACDLPIRHGEGRFQVRDDQVLQALEEKNLIALTYDPVNPNGSLKSIAGISDPTGRIFGLMPHPEAFVTRYNHPLWRRKADVGTLGLKILENGVDYFKK